MSTYITSNGRRVRLISVLRSLVALLNLKYGRCLPSKLTIPKPPAVSAVTADTDGVTRDPSPSQYLLLLQWLSLRLLRKRCLLCRCRLATALFICGCLVARHLSFSCQTYSGLNSKLSSALPATTGSIPACRRAIISSRVTPGACCSSRNKYSFKLLRSASFFSYIFVRTSGASSVTVAIMVTSSALF